MTTMADVARHAGVSAMTVSNVINNHPHVRPQTRTKVEASIRALGYRINTTARSLRQGRTGVIGLALPEIDRPYFGLLSELMIARAARDGFDLVIEQTGARREDEVEAIGHARLRSYDGLLLHASELSEDDAALLRADYPIVVLGERTYAQPVDQVVMANTEGGRVAGEHLIERGCQQVVMIGGHRGVPTRVGASTTRGEGFLEALAAAGREISDEVVWEAPYTLEGGRAVVADILAAVPEVDGIFCATDLIAFGVIRGLADRGISVPGQVRVVGFDNVTMAAHSVPTLTSLAPDHEAMVDAAVALLVRRIKGEREPGDYQSVIGAVRLVERESSAAHHVVSALFGQHIPE